MIQRPKIQRPAPAAPGVPSLLTEDEIKELLPEEKDRTLIGNRLESVFKALGVPPCGGCIERRDWLNAAHKLLRNPLAIRVAVLHAAELADLFPTVTEQAVINQRLTLIVESLGMPPAHGCSKRLVWINSARAWAREAWGLA